MMALLKIYVSDGEIAGAAVFNILPEILSMPVAS